MINPKMKKKVKRREGPRHVHNNKYSQLPMLEQWFILCCSTVPHFLPESRNVMLGGMNTSFFMKLMAMKLDHHKYPVGLYGGRESQK